MRGPRKLSDLIEDIYDAALEPARWNDVFVSINEFVGGLGCGIFSKNLMNKSGAASYFCGADPHYIQLYSETYSKLGPLTSFPPLGSIVTMPDLVPYDEFRRGRFYQEYMLPQGCTDIAGVVLENSKASSADLLTVYVRNRMVDDEIRQRIKLIAPHAHRSLTINKAIDDRKSEAAAFADTLDGLSAGIFLVDAQCRIVHTNAAGRSMLLEDDVLRSISGQLVARDAQANQGLRKIIANGGVGMEAGRGAFSLIAHDGQRYVAYLMPLASLARNGIKASLKSVAAAVFVRKVELDGQSWSELVARAFGLTPAESRVLLAIVEVGGVPETSQTLGVAETTVKTHLYRVFSKTGASRQADLVKLAAGFSNPLAN
jgi:DNA-binding CsgD family transcriptional regulator/PAS domain-containing protein